MRHDQQTFTRMMRGSRTWTAALAFAIGLGAAAPAWAQSSTAPSANAPAAPSATPSPAKPSSPGLSVADLMSGVVRISTYINPDARTRKSLGRNREGTGIVIDSNGLVLTIGYLMLEAHAAQIETADGRKVPADIVGYDHETGFGLLRASVPIKARPIALGRSAGLKEGDPVIIAAHGGPQGLSAVRVSSRREFAGYWEYLLDSAIFTMPPVANWSGAGLVNREGKLVGIGSLIVGDAGGPGQDAPGNMFVPIDLLPPILADLIADGRADRTPRPWLGLNIVEFNHLLVVRRVTPNGPADKAGLTAGDVLIGVDGEMVRDLADFYRKVWARGRAGVIVPLDTVHNGSRRKVDIHSLDRMEHLRLKSTF